MTDSLSAVFGALADPTRRAILSRLAQGEASVAELAKPFGLSPRTIAKHVGVLEQAGMVSRRRDAQRNMARLVDGRFAEAEGWIHEQRGVWSERLTNLAAHVNAETPR